MRDGERERGSLEERESNLTRVEIVSARETETRKKYRRCIDKLTHTHSR